MELHMAHEKHQMLDLNRRLESYLGRVKLLEEENTLLAQEIQALRHGQRGAPAREKSLKEDLRRAREELDQVWRERVYAQMDVCKLSEEIQMVERHRQEEARAQAEVKAMMQVSKKELEEEHGAHRWLGERIRQMEEEMEHLVRNHEAEVARLETALRHSAPRAAPTLDLLQLEQELSQQASRAWQETAENYQAQLDQMEAGLRETAAHLDQTECHKNEYQAQLRGLERERISEGDVRRQLEETAERQREEHRQHINTLQEHWEVLEKDKQHLGQQLDHLVQENRGLLQQKMSLGLEVVTYRALLDGESLRRDDVGLLNVSRNMARKDMPGKSFRGNYQLPVHCNTLTSVRRPPIHSTTPLRSKPVTVIQAHKDEETNTRTVKRESPYPKILQNGAVEKFRAQEVEEKVTYAEPLSSPGEEQHKEHPGEGGEEEYGDKSEDNASVGLQLQSGTPVSEGLGSRIIEEKNEISRHQSSNQQAKSELVGMTEETFSSTTGYKQKQSPLVPVEEKATVDFELQSVAPPLTKEISQQQSSTQEQTLDILGITEGSISSSPGWKQEQLPGVLVEEKAACGFKLQPGAPPLTKEIPEHQSNTQKSKTQNLAMTEETFTSSASIPVEACMVVEEQEQTSSSGSDALLEPTLESRTSSLSSQGEFNPVDVTEIRQEISDSTLGTTVTEAVDLLYPDGEEMDTWDSVIEKKIHVESNEPKPEVERQYAEPEEDISTRRSEPSREEMMMQEEVIGLQRQEGSPHSDDENINEEDDDSQNVSVSWRTELESDSYAQENTLADMRPLIRYTSDDTDANTQASHVDESESSDAEQDRKTGEEGGPAWSESKAKNFGTMEDLCEEVDEEVVEYDLEYSQETSGLEKTTSKVSEDHLNEEVPAYVVDVDLETNRLVEQELENLSTDSYASHFAQEVTNESQVVLPEEEKEVHGKMSMNQEVIAESDLQVTRSLDLGYSMQPQPWQEAVEKEVQDGMMTKEQELITESDVLMESKLDLRDSVQPQMFQEVEDEESQDRMINMEEVVPESANLVENDQVPQDSVQTQLDFVDDVAKEKVEEKEVHDRITPIEQEVIMEPDVQVECNQDLGDSVQPQLDFVDDEAKEKVDEREVPDQTMTMEQEVNIESEIQAEHDQVLRDSVQPQLDSLEDDEAKEKVEEREVHDQIMTIEKEVSMEPDVQVECNQDLGDFMQPQLDSLDDVEVKENVEEKDIHDQTMTMEQEVNIESEIQAEHDQVLRDSMQPQLDSLEDDEAKENVDEREVHDQIMTIEKEVSMEPDVQVECNQDLGDFMQPQLDSLDDVEVKEKVEEKDIHDQTMTMEQEVNIESEIQVEHDQVLRDSVQPQLDSLEDDEAKEKVEVREVHDRIITMEEEVIMESDVQVERNQDLSDFMQLQLDSRDDEAKEKVEEREVHDQIMTMEQEVIMESDVQVECDQVLRDSVQLQLDSLDDDAMEKVEVREVCDQTMTMGQEVIMESRVQMERNQDLRDLAPPQLDTIGDEENVQDEIMTMEEEEDDKGNLPSCMDPGVQVEDNLDFEDSVLPQLAHVDDDGKKEMEEEIQNRMLKEEEAQKVYQLSCTESDVNVESNLDLVPPQSDSPRNDSVEETGAEDVQDGMMAREQEEPDKVSLQASMDSDVQAEDNLDLRDFVLSQLDSPDDYVKEEVQDEIFKNEEARKVYLLSCTESEVQVECNLNFVQPQVGSPDDCEKVQDKRMSMVQEEANNVNVPSCMDPDVQVEDNLDLKYFVQPQLDSLDDYLEEGQDVTLKQEDTAKVNVPIHIDPDLQNEDSLGLRDFVKPQLDSPDNKETIDEGVKDASEDSEEREDEFNVSMVTHAEETFSEFLSGPNIEDEEEERLHKTKCESQNQEDLLQPYTSSVVEHAAAHITDELNILENTSKYVDCNYPKDEEGSGVSHLLEEVGDGEGAATFDKKPIESPPETAPEESDIFSVKGSSSEFHKTNSKGKRNLWAANLADKGNVLENASEDVDIRDPKDEEQCVVSHLHEEEGDGEGAPTFDEKPVEISPETAPEDSVIFDVKDSLSEFHKTNGKDKRDFWTSSLEVDAADGSDDISVVMSGIRDVEFGGELEWRKAVNGSSAHGCAAKKEEHAKDVSVHSEESEVEGDPWSSGDE
ncbi:nestin [Festucalex cinctus]